MKTNRELFKKSLNQTFLSLFLDTHFEIASRLADDLCAFSNSETRVKQTILADLDRTVDRMALDPALEPPSSRALFQARKWIVWVQSVYGTFNAPYLIVPGDGSIIVEWENNRNVVSLKFDGVDSDFDSVFFRMDGAKDILDLTKQNVKTKLDALFSIENSATVPSRLTSVITGTFSKPIIEPAYSGDTFASDVIACAT